MEISPDSTIFWQYGFAKLNATLLYTWILMAVLTGVSWAISRRLLQGGRRTRLQNFLEVLVLTIEGQLSEVGLPKPRKYIGFIGTLFLYVAFSGLCTIVPGYKPPTASLSTTLALAFCVFFAVPIFGMLDQGLKGYLGSYLEPTAFMLPFNVIGEISRTMALAVRLFGNMMSGEMIVGILLVITPFFFPILMTVLGLLTSMVQAYIFSILATVYIAAALRKNGESLV
jgi:F-type H+-transporting ATPase subunit a